MHNPALAARNKLLNTESAFQVLDRARALEATGRDVVHLEIGQPDFPTPGHIVDAAFKAVQDGATGYAPTVGIPELREAVAEYTAVSRGVDVTPERVVITPGAKPIMFFSLLACVEAGDEVIYPDPGFPIYESVIRFIGAKPVPIPLRESLGFRFDVDELRELVTPKTRMLIVNSPGNPTGGVLGDRELDAIGDLATANRFWVLSDEVYSRLLYGSAHRSILSYDGMADLTILLDGVSKTYAMTGWRLGWGVMPERLVEAFGLLMVNSNSCTAPFTQHAGVAALRGPQDAVDDMHAEFTARRDLLIDGLNAIEGMRCEKPEGAFYAFPNVTELSRDDGQFAHDLLEEAGVATLWGSSFGSHGAGHLRLSYANSRDALAEALRRIRAFAENVSP
ncbi:pyridoxal phosphate-dependent aminotransferase [Candidatus Poribacteria bacterium]|nr:pyridoxal phosphate-dependent aminotransferase [Candidatus Poribacteria bacterium]MBT5534817.1 pyridoxal phosphate-dependent aminotransferase [Candidatus Poribacteria bacterium]MBT5710052.1 pyridoxal phosphate-dependent aminotransferase [Candidatus Poribacteria bacterium]MBT7096240.1 pyridoxal phosphate-dependent aminotransferase [Candidatus Poribacteria bacterium]